MWILQEYRFYLIIAVIALAGIIALFFFVQSKQSYTSFTTDLNARYAQVQSIGKESNSIRDILTSDGVNLLGTEGNTLFGLSLDGSPDDIKIIDTDALDTELPTTIPSGTFRMSFATTNSITGNALRVGDMASTMGNTDKWWNLGNDGAIVYSFENESVAKKVMADYLPEGSLSGKHIFIPFTSTAGSTSASKALFSYYTTGTLPSGGGWSGTPTLPTINQDDMCNNPGGCTCSVTSTTVANGTICDAGTSYTVINSGDTCNDGAGCTCSVTGDWVMWGTTCTAPGTINLDLISWNHVSLWGSSDNNTRALEWEAINPAVYTNDSFTTTDQISVEYEIVPVTDGRPTVTASDFVGGFGPYVINIPAGVDIGGNIYTGTPIQFAQDFEPEGTEYYALRIIDVDKNTNVATINPNLSLIQYGRIVPNDSFDEGTEATLDPLTDFNSTMTQTTVRIGYTPTVGGETFSEEATVELYITFDDPVDTANTYANSNYPAQSWDGNDLANANTIPLQVNISQKYRETYFNVYHPQGTTFTITSGNVSVPVGVFTSTTQVYSN